jgi:hypothetical protein
MPDNTQDFSNLSGDFAMLSRQIFEKNNERKKHMKTHIATRIKKVIALVLFSPKLRPGNLGEKQ